MISNRSIAATPLGSAWECNPGNPCNGFPAGITSGPGGTGRAAAGNPGVVVHSGVRAGRLIVASCEGGGFSPNPPETTWSDVGGGPPSGCAANPWAEALRLDRYGPPPSGTLAGVNQSTIPTQVVIPVPNDIEGMFKDAPSIAVDPSDPSNVYVAFIGRRVPDSPDGIDFFIGWTNTGNDEVTGPFLQGADRPWGNAQRTYHIPDTHLVVPGDPDLSTHHAEQCLPALAIDDFGGINILYCQTFERLQDPQPSTFKVYYARWPSRAALDAGQAPAKFVLSPSPSGPGPTAGHEYNGITASGCTVYAAWASNHSGTWHATP